MQARNHPAPVLAAGLPTGILLLLLALITAPASRAAEGGDGGDFVHSVGPFDYTNPVHVMEHLAIVEKHHFTPEVENLQGGISNAYVINDLIYTLRTFPNHHRALVAMSRLWRQQRGKHTLPPGASSADTPEFYFDKAISFAPHDATVKLLYGIHLHNAGKHSRALEYYKAAEQKLPDSPELQYNMGLLYYDMRKMESARLYAEKAYGNNYPLQGLKNKLKRAGAWN